MGRLTDNTILGGAILTAVVAAALLTFRWFAPARSDVPQTVGTTVSVRGDSEATATIKHDFGVMPKMIATIPIKKPPPTPDRAYVIPKSDEGEHVEPEPVVEASADLKSYLAPPRDVCARNGGRKVTYTRHHHESWRCVYRRHS